jgi:ATP-dependent DNA ligase
MWLNGIDLRSRPLLDRKRRLHRLIPPNDSHLLYIDYLDGDGRRFFEPACEQDLERIICKPKTRPYPFTWIEDKNPNYMQAAGRKETFDRLLPQQR